MVADVSFISLTKVLPAVLACCAERFDALAMVKPQFEVGRERVGKGGVVRSPERPPRGARRGGARAPASRAPRCSASRPRACRAPRATSETFVWLAEAGRAAADADLEALAREVEP